MSYILKLTKFWILMVFVIVCGFFGLNNQQMISINLNPILANDLTMSAYRIYFAVFFLGATVASLFFGLEYTRKSIVLRGLKKKILELQTKNPASTDDAADKSATKNKKKEKEASMDSSQQ